MNRKERRAAQKQGKGAPGAPTAAAVLGAPGRDQFAAAVQHFRAGQSGDAERLCREALVLDPLFFDALHLLGFIAFQAGRDGAAIDLLGKAAGVNPRSPECHFHLGLALHRSGQPEPAIAHFTQATALKPDFAAAHMNLGNMLMQQGRLDAAKASYQRVLALDPGSADARVNLGNAFMRLDQLSEAEAHYRRAVELKPDHAGAHINLGAVLIARARVTEAADCFRRAAACKPDAAEAHRHLADALVKLGEWNEAEAAYRRALVLSPNAVAARHGLANLKLDQGEFAQALDAYQQILAMQPDHAEVRNNLGIALAALGRHAEAEAQYRQALARAPDLVDIYRNLGRVVLARGDVEEALALARQALTVEETVEAKAFFVECAKQCSVASADGEFRALVARALSEGWSRPGELSGLAANLLARGEIANGCFERAVQAWPRRLSAPELYGDDGLALIAADTLLGALLESAPVRTIALERFLTDARHALLDAVIAAEPAQPVEEDALAFFCALARQCFINEYVFAREGDEWRRAQTLRDALDAALAAGTPVPALWPVAVAAYMPLHGLAQAATLVRTAWPDPITQVVKQQVQEPLDERKIRGSIPALTTIDDDVSLQVRNQYEEMPYPRWVKTAPVGKPVSVDWHLRNRFPGAPIRNLGKRDPLDVLIAGCGTGQHSIETAQRFAGAKVLAVDLSLSSLSYAVRQSRALGLANVAYMQADILKLGTTGRSFDVIEASGVLHHLRDPAEGWRILLSLLRPGGLMNVGLYSAPARSDVRAARAFIAERGFGRTADDIRNCRQEMMAFADGTPLRNIAKFPDFFTTSECRDLLFHVQEHQMTIPEIKAFLGENHLAFVGFGGDADRGYRRRFPQDPAMTDLDNWHAFETENPTTFVGMYQFWVQKR